MNWFIILIFLSLSHQSFSAEVSFFKNNKVITKIDFKEDRKLSVKTKKIYNPWRKYTKKYQGFELYYILDQIYGRSWRKANLINFKAIDGYTITAVVEDMLKASKGKIGLLSFKEKNKKSFTEYIKNGKKIEQGPWYLVWSGFSKKDKVSHVDALKWPYQLKEIHIEK